METKAGGIPSGFAHDRAGGAESAAANYAVALGSARHVQARPARHEIVNTVYAPTMSRPLQADLDKAYSDEAFLEQLGLNEDGTAPDGQTFVSRTIPVGTKVTSSSERDGARVEVWYTGLFGLAGDELHRTRSPRAGTPSPSS